MGSHGQYGTFKFIGELSFLVLVRDSLSGSCQQFFILNQQVGAKEKAGHIRILWRYFLEVEHITSTLSL